LKKNFTNISLIVIVPIIYSMGAHACSDLVEMLLEMLLEVQVLLDVLLPH
jgi:sirohydrochlorin ferrochelatase